MVARKISATEAGLPYFEVLELEKSANTFSLESHTRAKEALERGLEMSEPGFNIFVVGEDRSGRMTATLAFLEEEMAKRPPPPDWLYLNNFLQENQPHAFPLPSGLGKVFKTRLNSLISQIREGLVYAFDQEKMQGIIKSQTEQLNADILEKLNNLRSEAHDAGLEINQTQQGLVIVNSEKLAKATSESKNSSEEDGEDVNIRVQELEYKISQFTEWVTGEQIKIQQSSQNLGRKIADATISMLVKDLKEEFSEIQSICDWLDELQMDATENFHLFLPPQSNQANHPGYELPERRYAVN
ncbi:MAG: Lon-like protease helical domain-containing protein, partial [Rhodospirillales bacterium]